METLMKRNGVSIKVERKKDGTFKKFKSKNKPPKKSKSTGKKGKAGEKKKAA